MRIENSAHVAYKCDCFLMSSIQSGNAHILVTSLAGQRSDSTVGGHHDCSSILFTQRIRVHGHRPNIRKGALFPILILVEPSLGPPSVSESLPSPEACCTRSSALKHRKTLPHGRLLGRKHMETPGYPVHLFNYTITSENLALEPGVDTSLTVP